MKTIENDTKKVFGLSPNPEAETPNSGAEKANHIGLYQKCLDCPDYGVTCNGPKLAALGDIMVVRKFHRAMKNTRKITLKAIADASPSISEYTVNDYFSHSVKDFKWTTVGVIDNALTAICGNRVGKPLLDHPCPASSSDIQDKFLQLETSNETLRAENLELQKKILETKAKVISTREEIKEDYASRVQFLKELSEQRQREIDEMEQKHQKEISRMDAVAADYLSRIDEKNKRIDSLNRANHILVFVLVCVIVALTCYMVWDLMHPAVGLFQW